jgi:hypothetical protein
MDLYVFCRQTFLLDPPIHAELCGVSPEIDDPHDGRHDRQQHEKHVF